MKRRITLSLLGIFLATGVAAAQTATSPTTTSNTGAFDKLSPGNQKIARALYEAQQAPMPTSGSTSGTTKTYSLDDIAAMKQSGKGWGVIFKEMQAKGYYPGAKNLGQVVSGRYHPQSGTTGSTTITSASGKSQVVRGSVSSGPGRGYGYGHGDSSGSSSGGVGSGVSGHGGRGK